VEYSRHDHAQLVATDDGEDDCKVLPGDLGGGRPPVPEKKGEEDDEAHQMGPNIECLIVQG